MTDHTDHHQNPQPQDHPDLTPGLLDPELRRLDARLTNQARRLDVPPGLADRVFEASVGHLPARRLRFTPTPRQTIRIRRQRLGRLALAAGIALAFVLSARMLQSITPTTTPEQLAIHTPPHATPNDQIPVDMQGSSQLVALSMNAERLLYEFAAPTGEDISYLAETRYTTLADLDADWRAFKNARFDEGGM